ncbi:putative holin-like toxin [Listeria immobilis]
MLFFFALPGKDKRVTVFESLTLMIAFAVLIVTIMNSKNDKK